MTPTQRSAGVRIWAHNKYFIRHVWTIGKYHIGITYWQIGWPQKAARSWTLTTLIRYNLLLVDGYLRFLFAAAPPPSPTLRHFAWFSPLSSVNWMSMDGLSSSSSTSPISPSSSSMTKYKSKWIETKEKKQQRNGQYPSILFDFVPLLHHRYVNERMNDVRFYYESIGIGCSLVIWFTAVPSITIKTEEIVATAQCTMYFVYIKAFRKLGKQDRNEWNK